MKLKLHATGKDLIIKESERLISGSRKIYNCEFTFDESWDGYTVTAVFSTNSSRLVNMAIVDGKCEIPSEVLRPNARIRVGIFGIDGERSRPTTYSDWVTVEQGTDVTGSSAQPPTPSVYEQWMNALDEKHEEWNEQEQARQDAETARVEAEQAREDLETGYVARAEAAAESAEAAAKVAEDARDVIEDVAGGNFATKTYVDQQIAAIPTPDVSGQIDEHNTSETAHADIREELEGKAAENHTHTAEDVGALPTTGGEMTGQIKMLDVADTTQGTRFYANQGFGISVQSDIEDDTSPRYAMKLNNPTVELPKALALLATGEDGKTTSYAIYGTHNKPTAADVKAITYGTDRTTIPANADLNSYTSVGMYKCPASSDAKTLKNSPTASAFIMDVVSATGSNEAAVAGSYTYVMQRLYMFTGEAFYRSIQGTTDATLTYGTWRKMYDSSNITSGTTDLTAGTASLATGSIYLVYE